MPPRSRRTRHALTALLLLASVACSTAPLHVMAPPPRPVGARPATAEGVAPANRETRYYRDECGQLWDDRGRRVEEPR
jgi:hypothetical protein